jgi:hypothetical protein
MTYPILDLQEFAESKLCPIEWSREIENLIESQRDLEYKIEQIRDSLNLPFPFTKNIVDRAREVTALHDDVIEELDNIGLSEYGPVGTSTGTILRAALGALTDDQIDVLLSKSKQDYDL